MLVKYHIISGLIASGLLFPIYDWYSLIVLISSFIFDIDHYLFFIITKKEFSLRKAYSYFKNTHDTKNIGLMRTMLMVFHTLEFYILLIVLSLLNRLFLMVLIGVLLHGILDAIDEIRNFGELKPYSITKFVIKKQLNI